MRKIQYEMTNLSWDKDTELLISPHGYFILKSQLSADTKGCRELSWTTNIR